MRGCSKGSQMEREWKSLFSCQVSLGWVWHCSQCFPCPTVSGVGLLQVPTDHLSSPGLALLPVLLVLLVMRKARALPLKTKNQAAIRFVPKVTRKLNYPISEVCSGRCRVLDAADSTHVQEQDEIGQSWTSSASPLHPQLFSQALVSSRGPPPMAMWKTKAQPRHVVTKRFKIESHFHSSVQQIRNLQEALKFLCGQICFF